MYNSYDAKMEEILKIASMQGSQNSSCDIITRLFLARHGELTTSKEWRYVGHQDVGLNSFGISQIEKLAYRLIESQIEVIVSSDLVRCKKSAEIIGTILGIKPSSQSGFREISLGRWEGKTKEEIITAFSDEFEKRALDISSYRIEGGESFLDLEKRVMAALKTLISENRGKNILLVAHGGVNRVILCNALRLQLDNLIRLDQSYACLNIIDYIDSTAFVRLVNETNY